MKDKTQIPIDPSSRADDPEADALRDDGTHEVARDLAYKRLGIVNVVFYGVPGTSFWVLIDAGLPGTGGRIAAAAEERFQSPPECIILTHGHFDHVGALSDLAGRWDVPVYAHQLEHPYLNGTAAYPPADRSVGGGLMATLSPLYPHGPYDFSRWLTALPADGAVPHMPDWTWVHTPGHTPGHISLWRPKDRALIAGDAIITTRQESAYAAVTQMVELHGPPMYFTQDFTAAHRSVEALASLDPEVVITGHGRPISGTHLRDGLRELALNFDIVAIPDQGKYVKRPATVEDGSAYERP